MDVVRARCVAMPMPPQDGEDDLAFTSQAEYVCGPDGVDSACGQGWYQWQLEVGVSAMAAAVSRVCAWLAGPLSMQAVMGCTAAGHVVKGGRDLRLHIFEQERVVHVMHACTTITCLARSVTHASLSVFLHSSSLTSCSLAQCQRAAASGAASEVIGCPDVKWAEASIMRL